LAFDSYLLLTASLVNHDAKAVEAMQGLREMGLHATKFAQCDTAIVWR
jgi:hypothetical protein